MQEVKHHLFTKQAALIQPLRWSNHHTKVQVRHQVHLEVVQLMELDQT